MSSSNSPDLAPSAPDAEPAPLPSTGPRRAWSAGLRQLPVVIPPLVWAIEGWNRRWIADDGLIVTRTVRQILAGNGPVFNRGERVEADTSVLWTWMLAATTWLSRLNIDTVIIWTGLVLAPLGLLFALLGARELHRRLSPGRPLLPVGAAIVLAVSPFWDFVTSGLEDSLIFCWLGLCWWLLAGLRPGSRRRAGWLAFVAGLGWLVRPDMALGTLVFLAALWSLVRPGWRRAALLVVIAGAVPTAYQVFRMGYYGLLVPNTAVAKDASTTRVSQGVTYLANFISPYWTWLPLLLLLALSLLTVGQRLNRADAVTCAAPVVGGMLMAAYVIAIGGDFMHARMLLPATFALLLPVMMLPVPEVRSQVARAAVGWLCVGAISTWAVACAVHGRDQHVITTGSGIVDERAYWVAHTHQQYPDGAAEFVAAVMGSPESKGRYEWLIMRDASSGRAVLLYDATGRLRFASVPLDRPGYSVADVVYILGSGGAGTPLDGLVVDLRGLSYALASHMVGNPNARPGHTKFISASWVVAEYSDVTTARGIPAAQLVAARKALSCGQLAELSQATQAPLTFGRFLSNIAGSFSLTSFRFPPNPVIAQQELCQPTGPGHGQAPPASAASRTRAGHTPGRGT